MVYVRGVYLFLYFYLLVYCFHLKVWYTGYIELLQTTIFCAILSANMLPNFGVFGSFQSCKFACLSMLLEKHHSIRLHKMFSPKALQYLWVLFQNNESTKGLHLFIIFPISFFVKRENASPYKIKFKYFYAQTEHSLFET